MADKRAFDTNKYPAKYVCTMGTPYYYEKVFEYRGREYSVEYSSSFSSFASVPASVQHKQKQKEIDDLLDNPKTNTVKTYDNSAEKAIDDFLAWCNQ